MRVAIIEDDPDHSLFLGELFARDGARPEIYRRAAPFLRHASLQSFDLAVLDLRLPDVNGIAVLQQLNAMAEAQGHPATPVMVVTGCAEVSAMKDAFDHGALDYVTKPFHGEVLLTRARAIAQRTELRSRSQPDCLERAGVRLNRKTGAAWVQGHEVRLSRREFQLAWLMFCQAGQAVPRAKILHLVWGQTNDSLSRSLDTHICRLRSKLKLSGAGRLRLSSVYAMGYRLDDFS